MYVYMYVYVLTFNVSELFDGSGATISRNNFNTLERRNKLWEEGITIYGECFVKLSWCCSRDGLVMVSENTHDELVMKIKRMELLCIERSREEELCWLLVWFMS